MLVGFLLVRTICEWQSWEKAILARLLVGVTLAVVVVFTRFPTVKTKLQQNNSC
jgi:hypothetical protein